ncbi:type VI secretion system-associated FHA domain protein TagH [Nereida sp. MMG025]|uniref:type VI secretion system-associated FHA domain protein TagH n=1 Tax=Nereida sp. MMG025 TaxID=2909981 RepID=UPI001F009CBF|nr:type VI secretion system-associated FHA domain protein TagH [Nereida sp. MMG025]MCF6445715.1 type VI secretion system-associated FHA domain protein TagH [Nereida sp. MMG025]
MTTLVLRIENHPTLDTGGPISLRLDQKGAQVGRKAGNDWVLPDASRHISGHHFDIHFEHGQYTLVDVSSNGTFLHGERYRIDQAHPIKNGDRFTVGQYIIVAELVEAEQPQPVAPPPPAAVPSPPPPPAAPYQHEGYAAPMSAPADEFDDVWGDLGAGSEGVAQNLQTPSYSTPAEQAPLNSPRTMQPDYNAALNTPSAALTTPPQFALSGNSSVSTPPSFGQQVAAPPLQPSAPVPTPPPPAPTPPPAQSYAHNGDGFGAEIPLSAAPAPSPQPPMAPAGSANPQADAFLRGFMEGAEITDTSQLQIPPEALGRILGQVARVGTKELMRMLQDRTAVKLFVSNEDRTMRVATGNNPMKFLLNPDEAFEALFLRPRDGYQTGADGFENALVDIRCHQAAVIAALQPALAEMLGGLSPSEIEAEIGGGLMGGGGRKAWDEFSKRWETRASEGENGMLDAFIKAFSRHYADALKKM